MAVRGFSANESAGGAPIGGTRTIISQDLEVTGTILTDGALEVNGVVNGDICARTIVVGKTSSIKGRIVAEEVAISGMTQGRITARKIKLANGAQVESDLIHQTLGIEEGAEFEGSVLRKKDDAAWVDITRTFEIPGVELTGDAAAAVQELDNEFERGGAG